MTDNFSSFWSERDKCWKHFMNFTESEDLIQQINFTKSCQIVNYSLSCIGKLDKDQDGTITESELKRNCGKIGF